VEDAHASFRPDPEERTRELDCLYAIGRLAGEGHLPVSEILQQAVEIIPHACSHPEVSGARIAFGDREYRSDSFSETAWKVASDVVAGGVRVGAVEVCYLNGSVEPGPFSPEKRNLVNAIAGQLGRIAERQRAEDALHSLERKYEALAESLPDGLVAIDPATLTVLFANGLAADLFGLGSADELAVRPCLDLVHPDDRDRFRELVSADPAGAGLREMSEFRIARADGKEMWTRAQGARTEFKGKTATLVFLKHIAENERVEEDIRRLNEEFEQRVAERTMQLEAVNKELEAFAYSVSHDLRAPLRSVEGFSQILLDDYASWLDTQGRDYIQRVRSAARRMAQLVDDLLRFSRVTRTEMTRDTVDLSAIAETIAGELQSTQPERKAEFVIAPNLSAQGDAHLLRVALDNLIGNAWKFTRKRPQTRIEFGSTEANGQVIFFVRDNGVGFDMAYADKLFDGFQRLHSPADYEGTGIGLTTVKRIIDRHGGRIWADSTVDEGATFYFTLSPEESGK